MTLLNNNRYVSVDNLNLLFDFLCTCLLENKHSTAMWLSYYLCENSEISHI